jgi:hypothetical protein
MANNPDPDKTAAILPNEIRGQTETLPTLKPPKPAPTKTPSRSMSAKSLMRMLNKTKDLTDLAYENQVHSSGFRVALWLLRAYACAPIDKPMGLSTQRLNALLAYLERCDKHRELMASQRTRPAQNSPDTFLQQVRPATKVAD